jgi:hypothetical protein
MKNLNLIGKRFGRLTVVSQANSRISGRLVKRSITYWKCKCSCGETKEIRTDPLVHGRINSCGCIRSESSGNLNYKHGEGGKTKENRIWSHIINRCTCITDKKYLYYGGRGIQICDRWRNSYENFLQDMGRCPDNKSSIGRINNNGNYCLENCRWEDNKEQANNKRSNVFLEYNGIILTMKQWSEKLGYKYEWFHAQLKYKNKKLSELIDVSKNI